MVDDKLVKIYNATTSYKINEAGVFRILLKVEDRAGNIGMDNITVKVLDITPPIASAGENLTVKPGSRVVFNGSNSNDNVGIVQWSWSFQYNGKLQLLEGSTTKFVFDIPGKYKITLKVYDFEGNEGIDYTYVVVTSPLLLRSLDIWGFILVIVIIIFIIALYIYSRLNE